MATPTVSGSLILLQEYYNKLSNGSFMRAATLKGLALHTADDIEIVGPDCRTGWGALNAKKAAETLKGSFQGSAAVKELVLAQGQTMTYKVLCQNSSQLKASISWTDPAGVLSVVPNSNEAILVNDLDIRITKDGVTYFPWRLTGVNTNGKGDNIKDPFERIDIDNAMGEYTITISHKGVLRGGSQKYSLIVTGGVTSADYCVPNSLDVYFLQINKVMFNTINNSSTIASTGYSNFSNIQTTIEKGKAYTLSVTAKQSQGSPAIGYAAWIDYNQNGVFENSELVASAANASSVFERRVVVPDNALSGATRMRIQVNYQNPGSPCGQQNWAETEDYFVNIVGPDVVSPTAPENLAYTLSNNSVNLTWNAAADYEGVVAYDIYKNGILLATVPGPSAAIPGLPAGIYQFYVKARDAAGNVSANSNSVNLTYYCTNYNILTNFGYISNVEFKGIGKSSGQSATGYSDYTKASTLVKPGQSYNVNISAAGLNSYAPTTNYYVWIDYNQNQIFETGELAASATLITSSRVSTVTIPPNAMAGTTRMRIILNSLGTASSSCGIDIAGEVEDYSIDIDPNLPPTVPLNLTGKGTNNGVALMWDASTDISGIAGYEVYMDGVRVQTVSTNTANITGLTGENSYQFFVKAIDGDGNASGSSNVFVFRNYCTPYVGPSLVYIRSVKLNTINNVSAKGGYRDFTDISTELYKESDYLLSVNLYNGWDWSDPASQVWIDFNQNAVFEANEIVLQGSGELVSGNIKVPASAKEGATRMRVSVRNIFYSGACTGIAEAFDVEDYTVFIRTKPLLHLAASEITQNSVKLSWASVPDAVTYEVYRDDIIQQGSTPLTSYSVTGLSSGVTYQFLVKAKDKTGKVLATSNTIKVTTEYCTASGKTSPQSLQLNEIGNVEFNTINNSSPAFAGGYSNFSAISTTVQKGKSYVLTVSNTQSLNDFTHYYAAWIDYNQNGVFETSERVAYGVKPNTLTPFTYIVAIPNSALTGTVRMRVALRWGGDPLSCGLFEYGDVEDYSLNIVPTANYSSENSLLSDELNPSATQGSDIKIYPNPVSDLLYLSDSRLVIGIEVYGLSGELLMKPLVNKRVDVSMLNNGIYIMKIQKLDGTQQSVRFIKK